MQENNPDAPNPIRNMSNVEREGYYNGLQEKAENNISSWKATLRAGNILTLAKQSNLSPDAVQDIEMSLESIMDHFNAYKGDE